MLLVAHKLTALRSFLARAAARRPAAVDEFLADEARQEALSLCLLVAVQEATDIAFHIAADEGWGVPTANREAFEILSRHGVIGAPLVESLSGVEYADAVDRYIASS